MFGLGYVSWAWFEVCSGCVSYVQYMALDERDVVGVCFEACIGVCVGRGQTCVLTGIPDTPIFGNSHMRNLESSCTITLNGSDALIELANTAKTQHLELFRGLQAL